MAIIAKEEKPFVAEMFRRTVNEEKMWADYLFKQGSMIGLNDRLLHNYVEWIANRRMKAIGLDPIFDIPAKNNPLPWTEHWPILRVSKTHHKKRRLKVMSSEESNKMSKQTPSLDSVYDDLVETANEIGPDVTDMIWTAAKKEALRDRKNVSR